MVALRLDSQHADGSLGLGKLVVVAVLRHECCRDLLTSKEPTVESSVGSASCRTCLKLHVHTALQDKM